MVAQASKVIWIELELQTGIQASGFAQRALCEVMGGPAAVDSQRSGIRSPGTKAEELPGTEKNLMGKPYIILGL
jgi:hypothetical protein